MKKFFDIFKPRAPRQTVEVFTIRVIYKSGAIQDFQVTEFSIKAGTYTWTTYGNQVRPLQFGVDDIAAVWQLTTKNLPVL